MPVLAVKAAIRALVVCSCWALYRVIVVPARGDEDDGEADDDDEGGDPAEEAALLLHADSNPVTSNAPSTGPARSRRRFGTVVAFMQALLDADETPTPYRTP